MTGELDVAGGARRAATRSSTTSTTPRSCRGSRTAGSTLIRGHGAARRRAARDASATRSSRPRRAVILAGGSAPRDAADRGPGRDRRRVDQPRGDDRQGDPGAAGDPRRRRGRRRDVAGVPDARRAGDADRGRAAAAPARGGVRLRAGDRGAARATASTSAPARRPSEVAQRGRHGHASRPTDGGDGDGDKLLVALGRTPQTEDLGLEDVGLRARRARSRSTRTCRVPGHDWLYAIGDVNGRALFTHMGKYQARDRRRPHARPRPRARPRRRRPALARA